MILGDAPVGLTDEDFDAFRQMIRDCAGIHLSDSKRALVSSRLAKRVRHLRMPSYSAYRNHLATLDARHPEWQEMINAITTNKTEFFREAHHFQFLRDRLLPEIERKASQNNRRIRIWSAGCSTGEEPYTIAMTLAEHFGQRYGWDIRILASDIDTEVLARAESGIYNEQAVAGVPEPLRDRYFLAGKGAARGTYRVREDLRELITFRRINFNDRPWPIHSAFDFIFCRNVLIYFDREKQEQILRGFLDKLGSNGHLFLGHSENIMGNIPELLPLGSTIYQHRDHRTPGRTVSAAKPKSAGATQPVALQPIFGDGEKIVTTTAQNALVVCLQNPANQRGVLLAWPATMLSRTALQRAIQQSIADLQSAGMDTNLVAKIVCAEDPAAKIESRLRELGKLLEVQGLTPAVRRIRCPEGVQVAMHCGTGTVRLSPIND